MKTTVITEKERATYEAFLEKNWSDIQQSYAWGEFQDRVPSREKSWALGTMDGEELVGTALVIRQRLPFERCWLYVARGPVLGKGIDIDAVWHSLFEKIQAIAAHEKAVFILV
ncbi:MAG: hypothetical protein Q8P27_02485 [Candidatus Peregrinibacteria bacterium]|nr:hypothetical protein [Candidatus Peregrinibacteria bacterium]